MSWGIQKVGKPEALKRAIDAEVEKYSGLSHEEFANVSLHLQGLLDWANPDVVMSLVASGHGHMTASDSVSPGVFVAEYLNIEIKHLGMLAE